jgi:hypothetical protein
LSDLLRKKKQGVVYSMMVNYFLKELWWNKPVVTPYWNASVSYTILFRKACIIQSSDIKLNCPYHKK